MTLLTKNILHTSFGYSDEGGGKEEKCEKEKLTEY